MDLIFVTGSFPFGTGETFIENEIGYLAETFEHVYIYTCNPLVGDEEKQRTCPKNVEVFEPNNKPYKKYLFKALVSFRFWKEVTSLIGSSSFFKKCSAALYFTENVMCSSDIINEFLQQIDLNQNTKVVIYSYWLSQIGMTALNMHSILEKRNIKARVYSRCHGFDLYFERAWNGYLPFQNYMISQFDKIFPCSKQGERYLKQHFPNYKDKIESAYLGVPDYYLNKQHKRTPFVIVSCSRVVPIKRVKLIADALREIQSEIIWTHFGDGELFEELKQYINIELPENIKVNLPGQLSNNEIYKYYQENNVSLFINVSSSEGLPVSIMEACSFGIPIIATDVGGTKEIVSDGYNGYLLSENFESKVLACAIEKIYSMEENNYELLCCHSRNKYLNSFSAEKNYCDFCSILSQ